MTGIPFAAIVLNFSHTHSGPMSGFEGYATTVEKPTALIAHKEDLLTRTVKMVLEAVENLQSVQFRYDAAHLKLGLTGEGEIRMGLWTGISGYST